MTWRAVLWTGIALASPASADAPRTVPRAIETTCAGPVCATIDRRAGRVIVRRGRAMLWTAPAAPPAVLPQPGGAVIAEDYRPGGLVMLSDGPATLLVVLRNQQGVVARVRLGDVTPQPSDLPSSVSHRQWSVARFFDTDGSFVADLADGRRLRVTTAGEKRIEGRRSDRPAFCRYAEPTRYGPCATRN